ncbi:MAG TPA: alkaline phosphatase family protein [Candidatus Dormibacteraeota bacterium]
MKKLLLGMAGLCSTLAFGMTPTAASAAGAAKSPIDHTIIVYQENISFDHYFGTFGHGSNGTPAGASQTHQPSGVSYSPFRLDGSMQGQTCDVDHGYSDMIKMADHGAMDMYTQLGNNKAELNPSSNSKTTCPSLDTPAAAGHPALALGYYEGTPGDSTAPLQNYWNLASHYTLADNFFQGVYGPSTPGAEWLVAATNNTTGDPNPIGDKCDDYASSMPQTSIPNLGGEATTAGVSWAWFQGGFGTCHPDPNNPNDPTKTITDGYSAHHDPFQYFSDTADLDHAHAFDPTFNSSDPSQHQRDLQVLDDALSGTAINGTVPVLPSISWVKAPALDDGHPSYSGPAGDDFFIGDLVNRLKNSQYWGHTAVIVAFDETGGWWDHVAPPQATGDSHFATWTDSTTPNTTGGCQYPGVPGSGGNPPPACAEAGFGPRMPVLVISPHARKHFVDHDQMDTASLDQWVEWNYGLPALGVWGDRDTDAGSLRGAFDF